MKYLVALTIVIACLSLKASPETKSPGDSFGEIFKTMMIESCLSGGYKAMAVLKKQFTKDETRMLTEFCERYNRD